MIARDNPEYWKYIARLARRGGRLGGLSHDDAEDCAIEFQVMVLADGEGLDDLEAPGALDRLRQRLWWHIKTCVYRRNKLCHGLVRLALLEEAAASGLGGEPASPDPGPEEQAIRRAELAAISQFIDSLPARQRWLWYRVEVDQIRIVDLQGECGRSAGALYKELHQIRRLIRDRAAALHVIDIDERP
jgi:DNA-directed RNA polymerase specialized sigma24 family protein